MAEPPPAKKQKIETSSNEKPVEIDYEKSTSTKVASAPPSAPPVGVPDVMFTDNWLVMDYTKSNFPGVLDFDVYVDKDLDLKVAADSMFDQFTRNPANTVIRLEHWRTVPNWGDRRQEGLIISPKHPDAIVHPEKKNMM
jgi:hypothetical protein